MKNGSRFFLHTFNGSTEPPSDVEDRENYWILIGEEGTIVDDNQAAGFVPHDGHFRVLVKFDRDLSALGLENHNQLSNSLWIRTTDLRSMK